MILGVDILIVGIDILILDIFNNYGRGTEIRTLYGAKGTASSMADETLEKSVSVRPS